jgi:hypothetical protein
MGSDEFFQSFVGFRAIAERGVSQRFARQFIRVAGLLLDFGERFLRVPFCEENLAASEVEGREPRIQVLSFLQLGLGFIIPADEVSA